MAMDSGEVLTGRCYTRAQRIPLMIGRLPGAQGPLWGGPYTVTQFAVFCGGIVLLWLTRSLWAHLGTGWNGVTLIGLPALAAWAVRRARIDGRDPLHAALGIAAFVLAPATGRLAGRAWRPPAASACGRGRFFVTVAATSDAPPAPRETPDRPARLTTHTRRTRVEELLAAARALAAEREEQ
ncbi:hypothetical protein GCM10027569_86820 [Flindersiella endophytica]